MCVSVFVLFFALLWQPWFLHTFTYSLKTNAKNYQVQHLKLLFVPALEVAIVLAIAASENHIKNLAELQLLLFHMAVLRKFGSKNPIGFTNIEAFQKVWKMRFL